MKKSNNVFKTKSRKSIALSVCIRTGRTLKAGQGVCLVGGSHHNFIDKLVFSYNKQVADQKATTCKKEAKHGFVRSFHIDIYSQVDLLDLGQLMYAKADNMYTIKKMPRFVRVASTSERNFSGTCRKVGYGVDAVLPIDFMGKLTMTYSHGALTKENLLFIKENKAYLFSDLADNVEITDSNISFKVPYQNAQQLQHLDDFFKRCILGAIIRMLKALESGKGNPVKNASRTIEKNLFSDNLLDDKLKADSYTEEERYYNPWELLF